MKRLGIVTPAIFTVLKTFVFTSELGEFAADITHSRNTKIASLNPTLAY